ncbi:hypothetical protein RPMA_03170 [Tardiphaga alba]|uniref:DUF2214 domain-containing protein n=1 Tax=Tardiphaga alba TaxID=340268 RepID=A0ABX8A5J6_9BRAD|nr:hypothetical protein [Tardiphaga alba]QUS37969.1 hypothetical protein RPMA_03170 [Tardiphaga alba]
MTDAAPALFIAIEASGIGAAIRQSRWVYMVANVGHIVALLFFTGAIAVMDARLAGGLAVTAPGPLLRQMRRLAIAGFVGLVVTGLVLFTAEASHVVMNRVFLIKVALIGLGLLNVVWVEWTIMPKVAALPPSSPMPAGARQGALASLVIWLSVAICGRAIAYF